MDLAFRGLAHRTRFASGMEKAVEERSTTLIIFAPFLPKKHLDDPRYLNVMNQIKGWVPWSYDKPEKPTP